MNSIYTRLKQYLSSAKSSLRAAEEVLEALENDTINDNTISHTVINKALDDTINTSDNVIYGVFDGQYMIGEDDYQYPVASNYASKSKLVEGDKMKLTIKNDGAYIYKILEEVERKTALGVIIVEGNTYKILVKDVSYKILPASISFMKTQFGVGVGDECIVLLPAKGDALWCAYDAVMPKK